jgi:hypothetical protein
MRVSLSDPNRLLVVGPSGDYTHDQGGEHTDHLDPLQHRVGLPPLDRVCIGLIHPVDDGDALQLSKMADIPRDEDRPMCQNNTGDEKIRVPNLAIGFDDERGMGMDGWRLNGLAFSCRERVAQDLTQKATISRSGQLQCLVGRRLAVWFTKSCAIQPQNKAFLSVPV